MMTKPELVLTPTDFVSLTNQILEISMPFVCIEGELANFRISKNKWVYFDIKDDYSKVSCFGTIYALPGPLKDGMMINIKGQPKLHEKFGFNMTVQSIVPVGEGSIKKAYELLKIKLAGEGLFESANKRGIPYPPKTISLITSAESAAFGDFMKIIQHRWPFIEIHFYNTSVQGESAIIELTDAVQLANQIDLNSEALVIIRGGGSNDDLASFNDERLVRSIAASRIPTIVAIGHEQDLLLAEMAADLRASTPSNAAELLVPDKRDEKRNLEQLKDSFALHVRSIITSEKIRLEDNRKKLSEQLTNKFNDICFDLNNMSRLIEAYNPEKILERGYAIVKKAGLIVKTVNSVKVKDSIQIEFADGSAMGRIEKIN